MPFQPESIGTMKARFPQAIAKVSNPLLVFEGKEAPPSKSRKHVFDFQQGMRMIVSKDGVGRAIVHVSASFQKALARTFIKKRSLDTQACIEYIEQWFDKISSGFRLNFVMMTPIGAFHFIANER